MLIFSPPSQQRSTPVWVGFHFTVLVFAFVGEFMVMQLIGHVPQTQLLNSLSQSLLDGVLLSLWLGLATYPFLRRLKRSVESKRDVLEEQQRFLSVLIENAPDCIRVINSEGSILRMNPAGLAMIEASSLEEAKAYPVLELIARDDRPKVEHMLQQALKGKPAQAGFTLLGIKGSRRWVETRAVPLRDNHGRVRTVITFTRDLSQQHRTLQALEYTTRLYRLLWSVNQALVKRIECKEMLALTCEAAVCVGGFQLAWIGLCENDRLLPTAWSGCDRFSPVPLEPGEIAAHPLIDRAMREGSPQVSNDLSSHPAYPEIIERLPCCDLESVCVMPLKVHGNVHGVIELYSEQAGFFDQGMIHLLEGLAADLGFGLEVKVAEEQRHQQASELARLANHDPLTGLPNRRALFHHLDEAIFRAQCQGTQLALLVIDLDRFKDVNDSFGHGAGDELLCQVAQVLQKRLRSGDWLGRLGGDEFALILEDLVSRDAVVEMVTNMIESLQHPWWIEHGIEVHIGASVGIALCPDHGADAGQLIQHADTALYEAKEQGRGTYRFFDFSMTECARQRVELGACLRRALAENVLEIHFQPQIDMTTNRIIGAESLVRWFHPVKGPISPVDFIPVAEQTGLIANLDLWVLRAVCRQGRDWLDQGLSVPVLALNLSPYDFHRRQLDETIAAILDETGFPPHLLELELTETALMECEQESATILGRLKDVGVRLALDDFGTGYSSLVQLKRFDLDIIKIDKGFVDGLPHLREDCEITSAVVAIGHALGLKVLAEGVETEEQRNFLARLGCDRYQGYYHSQPLPAEVFARTWLPADPS